MLKLVSILRNIARWTGQWRLLPDGYLFDPITGSILITSLLVSAATTAASVGLEYLIVKSRKVAPVDRGKMEDVRISVPGYGEPIMRAWGQFRAAPVWFWHTPIVHSTITTPGRSGGKGTPKPPTPATVDHIYTTSLAGVICEGPISSVRRMWFDNDLVYNNVSSGVGALTPTKYEAESATLAGGANSTASSECSGGFRVQGIGSGGTVSFAVTASATGDYEIGIYYTSTTDKTFKVSVNGGASEDVVCLASGGVNIVAIQTLIVSLTSGANTILFANAGAAAPDLDKIELAPRIDLTPLDPYDRRQFTGLVRPSMVAPVDPDVSWPYYMDRPTVSSSVISTTLAKYGQPSIRIYTGTETQTADSAIIADKGAANAPAYRGVAYIVIEGMQLQAGRIPNVTIEVDQGTTAVNTIVQDVFGLVGVSSSNITVSALSSDTLTGLVVPSRRSASDVITELQTRFQFDMPEVDGKSVVIKRNSSSDVTIPYAELRAHLDGEEMPPFDALITDIDPLQLPKRVDLNYQDPELDFHNNTQSDMRLTGPQYDEQTISLSIVDSATNIKKLASVLLYKPELEGRHFRFTTGPKYMRVHPGSVTTLSLPNATHVVRITEAKYQLPAGVCEFEGVRQQASIYSPTGTGSVSTGYEAPIAAVPATTQGVIIDGPLLRPEDGGDGTQPVVYVAMCGRGSGVWSGGFLYQEFPRGSDNYKFVTGSDQQSSIGITSGTLGDADDPFVFDYDSSLTIDFFTNTELSSATEDEVASNDALNLIWVGSGGIGEYLQFVTAVAGTAPAPYIARYTISGLHRGRAGTEHLISTHAASEDVVVMDSTVKPRRMDLADRGVEIKYKFVSSNQQEEDVIAITQELHANSIQPYSTMGHKGTRDSAGSLLIELEGRTRIEGGLRAYQGGAVNEEKEEYRIQILTSDGFAILPNGSERILPIAVGMTQAALLTSDSALGKYGYVVGNTLRTNAFGIDVNAISAQTIEQTGNDVQATLELIAGNGELCGFGIVPSMFEWRGASYASILAAAHILVIYESTTPPSAAVFEYGVSKWSLSSPGSSRYRIAFSGAETRVYRNWTGAAGELIYSSPKEQTFPYRVIAVCRTDECSVSKVTVTTIPFAKTIYAAQQQVDDFGSVQDPILMDVWQHSKLTGPGPKTRVSL